MSRRVWFGAAGLAFLAVLLAHLVHYVFLLRAQYGALAPPTMLFLAGLGLGRLAGRGTWKAVGAGATACLIGAYSAMLLYTWVAYGIEPVRLRALITDADVLLTWTSPFALMLGSLVAEGAEPWRRGGVR